MGSHALLSPSSGKRWMACTPSAVAESKVPGTTSSFAEEGTLGHAIAEDILKLHQELLTVEEFNKCLTVHGSNQFYSEELHEHAQNFADFILEKCVGNYYLFIEKKLYMDKYVPEGSGTGDGVILVEKPNGKWLLSINDLKMGRGVYVNVEENTQLKIYAVGGLEEFGHIFDIDEIELSIYQPRLDNISTWHISPEDLLFWANSQLRPKAKLAFNGFGERVAGDHCGFCKVKNTCKALAEYNAEVTKKAFSEPEELTPEEIAVIIDKQDSWEKWINGVSDYALQQALSGTKWPGFKLVAGRGSSDYSDTDEIVKVLKKNGFKDVFSQPTLLAKTNLIKVIGKAKFQELVEPLTVKTPGKPTLAPESDKRPELQDATQVFDDSSEDLI